MTFTALWIRLELPRRARSLTVLALLVAFASATVLTAVAGARRADSAVQRLVDRTLPATVTVLPNRPGFDWSRIRALPEVAAVAGFAVSSFTVDGVPDESTGFPVVDAADMATVERPVVLAGRLADPAREDEIVVSAAFPGHFGKGVGDILTIRLWAPQQINLQDQGQDPGSPKGPVIRARIVGVVRSPWYHDGPGDRGSLRVSPALFARHPANFLGSPVVAYVNALVRLRGGEAAIPRFRDDLARVTGISDIDVWDNYDKVRHQQKVDRFEAGCLLAFGLAALAAALFLVGQSLVRAVAATVAELQVLRQVGLTPRQAVSAAVAGPFLAAWAGTTAGVGLALLASRWMPIGAAAGVEPSPGVDLDLPVLGLGWLLFPALVLAGAALTAAWALAATRTDRPARRSPVAAGAAWLGLPVPVVVGARFALEPGRGRTSVPVRPALLGAVVGVLGVLAAVTFSAAVSDAVAHPARFGQTQQLEAWFGLNGSDFAPAAKLLGTAAADPDVTGVNDARVGVARSGDTSVSAYTYAPVGGKALPLVTVSGRPPHGGDEIVLAPTSARLLGVGVGSRITLTGGGDRRHAFTVTGVGFVPEGSHNSYDEGAWTTSAGFTALFGDRFKFHQGELSLRPGADPDAVAARVTRATAPLFGGSAPQWLGPPTPPAQVREIQDVEELPLALGAFLLLLALGAVGHALTTAVRRRRHDVAVLRALGMTRRQSRLAIAVQASLLALTGLAVGVPLGLAVGRVLWRVVAFQTPLAYHPPLTAMALVLVAPVALLLANLLAAYPGHRAAALPLGQTLRTE